MRIIAQILPYTQIVLSVILITLVLLQQSDADLGGAFGGGDTANNARTRRGAEKTIFNASILVAILFVITSLAALIVR